MNKIIKGKDVNLFIDGAVVASSTSCQFTLTGNTADASAKDDPGNGEFDNPEFVNSSWTASNESFLVDVNHLLQLLNKTIAGDATVDVSFQIDGGLSAHGPAIISQLQLSAPNGDFAKLSLSLEGCGALSFTSASGYVPSVANSARIKGKALMIALGDSSGEYHTLAASTSHTLSVSVQSSEVATKDDNDHYSKKEVTGKSISLSTENLVSVDMGGSDVTGIFLERMMSACSNGETLKMSFGYYAHAIGAPAGPDVDHGTGTPLLVYGDFLCTSININGANKENATYSAEFSGKGAPSVGTSLKA